MGDKMKNKIDMHIHSDYSDGDYSPEKVVELVKSSNISTFSLTDHDTIEGNLNIINYLDEGMEFITGVEMTGFIEKGELHILGYDINLDNKPLIEELENQDKLSRVRVTKLIEYLRVKFGLDITKQEENKLLNKKGNVGRPSISKLLIEKGLANSVRDAFSKYLIEAHSFVKDDVKYLNAKEIIELIKGADGIPVLAHPAFLQMPLDRLDEYVKELKGYGLMGLEVYHSKQSSEYSEELHKLAKKHDLLISFGSDYHGPNVKPDVFLGKTMHNTLEKDNISLLNYIRSR